MKTPLLPFNSVPHWLASIAMLFGVLNASVVLAQPPVSPAMANTNLAEAIGLSYSPKQMMNRLLAIAEGAPPTRDELEREFGIQFRVWIAEHDGTHYVAAAEAPPFARPTGIVPRNMGFSEAKSRIDIRFNFEPSEWRKPPPSFCVNPDLLQDKLKVRWQAEVRIPGGHIAKDFYWTAILGGVARRLTIFPDERGPAATCLSLFSITFEKTSSTINTKEK